MVSNVKTKHIIYFKYVKLILLPLGQIKKKNLKQRVNGIVVVLYGDRW